MRDLGRRAHSRGTLKSSAHVTASLNPPETPAPDALSGYRPFVLFWFARVATIIGYQMLTVAVGWQVYALTSSAFDLGLIGLVQFLPAGPLLLLAGDFAGRYDRPPLPRLCPPGEAGAPPPLAAGRRVGRLPPH